MRAPLNLIDRLYLLYLAVLAALAAWCSHAATMLTILHVTIGLLIWILAANQDRSPVVRFLHDWYPLAMFIFSFEEVARFSLAVVPHWQDFHVMSFEQHVFSVLPNLLALRIYSRPFSELMAFGYFSYYPLFPAVSGMLYTRKDKQPFRNLVLESVLMYLIVFAVYIGFPTEGPRHALAGFQAPPTGWFFGWLVQFIQAGAGVHGNALPSSHVGLAFLCALSAQRVLPRVAPFIWVSLCLICAGAVYYGYHYISDVLAGVVVALTAATLRSLIVSLSCRMNRQSTVANA